MQRGDVGIAPYGCMADDCKIDKAPVFQQWKRALFFAMPFYGDGVGEAIKAGDGDWVGEASGTGDKGAVKVARRSPVSTLYACRVMVSGICSAAGQKAEY